jgi:hypothetical protein
MITELVNFAKHWIKLFPPSSGACDTFSPRTIMGCTLLDYEKHYKLPFGAYIEAHEDNHPTNIFLEITKGSICLDQQPVTKGVIISYALGPADE